MSAEQTLPQKRGWLTVNLVFQYAFGLVAMTMCLPSMQDWPATFGASQAAVQLTFAGFIAAYGGLQLLYGPLSDQIGRKPIAMFGLVLACAGSVLAVFAPNLTVLILARVLQGAGCAAGMVIGRAMVQDYFVGHEKTRVMAIVGMSMGLCPPLATVIGGYLHVLVGWRANFVLLAVLAAAFLACAWTGLPDHKPQGAAKGWREFFAGYARLAREPSFLMFAGIMSANAAAFYSFLGGTPLVLARYGVPPERIGWYIMAVPLSYIVGNLLTTRLAGRKDEATIMNLGQFATIGGIVLLLALALGGINTPLALVLPLLFLGIGHGLLAPPTVAGTVGVIPALAGTAAAIAGLLQQVTGAVGGFVVGLVPHDGAANLAWLMLLWALGGCAAQFMLFKFQRRGTVSA